METPGNYYQTLKALSAIEICTSEEDSVPVEPVSLTVITINPHTLIKY